jgi:hypothetical protein
MNLSESGPTAGRSSIYGHKDYVQGHVLASVTISSHLQAQLMQSILIEAMKQYAGRPQETMLAKWNNDLTRTISKAKAECWAGWK